MRDLSVFIDESGDFGPYERHAPYYILALVIHDQASSIEPSLTYVEDALQLRGLAPTHSIHTGPLIRRESDYAAMPIDERRSLFRVLSDFVRHCDLQYEVFVFEKREVEDAEQLLSLMSRTVGAWIRQHLAYFQGWNRVIVYYDNGQREVTRMVNSVFNAILGNVEVRKVSPADYRLFQAADLLCTLELLKTKVTQGTLSSSESDFFSTRKDSAERALKKNYLKPFAKKRFTGAES